MSNLKFWFPVFGYSAIIFCLSSIPGGPAPAFLPPGWDKVAHTVEYVPWGLLAARALRLTVGSNSGKIWWFAALAGFMYGLTDEFHQGFVPGREVSIYDALADFVGSAIGAGLYLITKKKAINNVRH